MLTLNAVLKEKLKNPDFKEKYDELQPEMVFIRALITARAEQGLTQKELSERSGIQQADISRLETGKGNPGIKTLQRLAEAMGYNLKIELERKA